MLHREPADPDDVPVDRIIISGGEVLVWQDLLFHALAALYERYRDHSKLMVQTNGDLLDETVLDRLLALHVSRIDVSSMDRYHPKTTLERRDYLTGLLESRGMVEAGSIARTAGHEMNAGRRLTYAFWGATEDLWIGPLWPRGRARRLGSRRRRPRTTSARGGVARRTFSTTAARVVR